MGSITDSLYQAVPDPFSSPVRTTPPPDCQMTREENEDQGLPVATPSAPSRCQEAVDQFLTQLATMHRPGSPPSPMQKLNELRGVLLERIASMELQSRSFSFPLL